MSELYSFLRLNNIPFYLFYVSTHSRITPSSVDEPLGYFYFLAITNAAAVNICAQVFADMFSVLLGIYLGVELLGPLEIPCITF